MINVNEVALVNDRNEPERILQFGEGNFIRAFFDWMVDLARKQGLYDGRIVACQPIPYGQAERINKQAGQYTVVIRDLIDGRMQEAVSLNDSISRCIDPYSDYEALLELARSPELEVVVSNTTEQGIVYHNGDKLTDRPPVSFPAKMTALLYERFVAMSGATNKGLLIIPLELIEDNGGELQRLILRYAAEWELDDAFVQWFLSSNHVVTTLVDRIVTGYPNEEQCYFKTLLGYQDDLLVTCEQYNLLAIQGEAQWADILPIHKTKANVIWKDDITPYRTRKLRILNGAHNAIGLAAYLAGHNYVIDAINDPVCMKFLRHVVYDEIVSCFDEAPELAMGFADDVLKRFANPFLKHNLLQIAIHGCSKFKLRCLPSILDYHRTTGQVPPLLSFSFAAFLAFYRGEMREDGYWGRLQTGKEYEIRDSAEVVSFFAANWETNDAAKLVCAALSNTSFWEGKDLTEIAGLQEAVTDKLICIEQDGIIAAMERLLEEYE